MVIVDFARRQPSQTTKAASKQQQLNYTFGADENDETIKC